MRLKIRWLCAVWLLLQPAALSAQGSEWRADRVEPAEASGWTEDGLARVHAYADSIGTAAMLVVTDGVTVLSRGPIDHEYRAHSLRKSFLSALLGIASGRGVIDLDASLATLGIDDTPPLTAAERAATVRQLMESRSGIYLPAASETPDMRAGRPSRGSHPPGTHWYYNNWDFNVLGTVHALGVGTAVGEAFESEIATPLGMRDFSAEDVRYQLEEEHSDHPSYKFRISARDLARFGLLYLQDGVWDERRILPEGWVAESTRVHSRTDESGTKSGYGMMWWVSAPGDRGLPASFTASGTGGQRLTVLPGLGTVVVHLMDTDDRDGPRIGTSSYDRLLLTLFGARAR